MCLCVFPFFFFFFLEDFYLWTQLPSHMHLARLGELLFSSVCSSDIKNVCQIHTHTHISMLFLSVRQGKWTSYHLLLSAQLYLLHFLECIHYGLEYLQEMFSDFQI